MSVILLRQIIECLIIAGKERWHAGCLAPGSGWTATVCSPAAASSTGLVAAHQIPQRSCL